MTLYLSLDGIDDYLQSPTLLIDKIVMDVKMTPEAWTRYVTLSAGGDFFHSDVDDRAQWHFGNIYKNGVLQSNNTTIVNASERATFDLRLDTPTSTYIRFFADIPSTSYTAGEIYDVKVYNGASLVAHYDMATGTVQDQTGNGNHATLTGGTWVDDGVGGGSVIDAGTITLSTDTTLNAIGSSIASGDSTLSADSSLSVDGSIICNGTSTFFGESSFNPLPNLISNGESGLSASTSLTAEGISYDPSKQIIGKITLTGKRDLLTNLVATRDLNIKVSVKRELITRLVGDIK